MDITDIDNVNERFFKNIINIQNTHFEAFNDSVNDFNSSLTSLNKKNNIEYKEKQNLIDKIYLVNQELFELQNKIQELTHNILESNFNYLNNEEKEKLKEYKLLSKYQKKMYSYLFMDNLLNLDNNIINK